MEHEPLTRQIIGCAMKVHRVLGPGFLESVYERALAHEVQQRRLAVDCGKRIQVRYDRVIVGEFIADMFVSVHAAATRSLRVVEMKRLDPIQPHNPVELAKGVLVPSL